jgi:23S rRNA (uracil1939-C5)-methyltransferase
VNELVELDLTALAAGGDAIGRDASGRVTFVAGGAPGDRVRARIVERHKSFARAELVEVLAASPARIAAPCPLAAARSCGGCPWMHVAPGAQLAAKQELAAGALRKLIARGLELAPPLAPVPPLRWRRRARFHLGDGAIGLDAPRSRRVTDVAACLQLDARLEAALVEVRAALAGAVEGRGELHLALGHRGDVHVVIEAAVAPAVAEALLGRAGIAGVVVPGHTAGAAAIELEPGLVGPADAFAQASAAGNRALIDEVVAAVAPAPGMRVLELFAGSGNFTRPLVAAGAEVVASDIRAPVDPGRAEWRTGDAASVVKSLAGERFDAVLLDPPRTGAKEAVSALAAVDAPRVIYVACDAATLARDLEILDAAGWSPRRARVLDLMPQTAHLEIVAVAERTG